MPKTSPAQGTLKRLIEAEEQAHGEILKAAEERAEEIIAQAHEQAHGNPCKRFASRMQAYCNARLAEAESKPLCG